MFKNKLAVLLFTTIFTVPTLSLVAGAEILIVPDNPNDSRYETNNNTYNNNSQRRNTPNYSQNNRRVIVQPGNIVINNYDRYDNRRSNYDRYDNRGNNYNNRNRGNSNWGHSHKKRNNGPIVVEINPFPQIKVYKRR